MIVIRDIDHLVLRVVDLQPMIDFYCNVLGCSVARRRDDIGLIQLRAGRSMLDLVPVAGELGRMGGAAPGHEGRNLDHLCFRLETFDEPGIRQHLEAAGIATSPAASRYGAEGEGPSIYVADPEGNTIELKGPPWTTVAQATAQGELTPANQDAHASKADGFLLEGGCTCRNVRYRMTTKPLFVHCCHCRWCQRETGASFALNALIEADRVEVLQGRPAIVETRSNSGLGQKISRCPDCRIALWSNYAGAGDAIRFVRVGTLDEPDRLPPDIHIFTSTKQPWVILPPDMPAVIEYYDRSRYWPKASLERRQALLAAKAPPPSATGSR